MNESSQEKMFTNLTNLAIENRSVTQQDSAHVRLTKIRPLSNHTAMLSSAIIAEIMEQDTVLKSVLIISKESSIYR